MSVLPLLTTEKFSEIGQLLFGEARWQKALADYLGVKQRHLHYIAKGARPPAQGEPTRSQLAKLITGRLREIEAAHVTASLSCELWTKTDLQAIGEALFGDRTWQASMRDHWGIPRPKMTRLKIGTNKVPADLAEGLRRELVKRERALHEVLHDICPLECSDDQK